MMRRRRRTPYGIILFTAGFLAVGVIGFIIGYRVYPIRNNDNNIVIEKESNLNAQLPVPDPIESEPDEITTPVIIAENSIRLETKIIFRTHYTKCQTIKDVPMQATEELIGLKENTFKEYALEQFKEWQVVRFSSDEVILFQRKDQICPDHYYVSEIDGFIVVFRFTEAGQKYVLERTDIPVSHLPDIDQEKIKRGILIRTRQEVNQLLEDYSS